MSDAFVNSAYQIYDAIRAMRQAAPLPGQTLQNFNDRAAWAQSVLILQLIDLAKAASYVALAVIGLISAFFVAIPTAGFWMLVCSTSALFFTLVSEFANRAYNPCFSNNPDRNTSLEMLPVGAQRFQDAMVARELDFRANGY